MKTVDISNHLREWFPKIAQYYYPSLLTYFANTIPLNSFTVNTGLVTFITTNPHGFINGQEVIITNAFNAVQINSLKYNGNGLVKVITDEMHFINTATEKYVKIAGCTPTEYNGLFEIFQVVDDYTFFYKINTAPALATVNGQILTQDTDNVNGVKKVNVVNANTFTYQLKTTNTIIGGTPTVIDYKKTKIIPFISIERLRRYLNGDQSLETSMYAIVNSVVNSNNGIEFTDAQQVENLSNEQVIQQKTEFSIVVSFEIDNNTKPYAVKDLAMNEFAWILEKSLCNAKFSSVYASGKTNRLVLSSHDGESDESGKRYIHVYNFVALGYVTYQDKFTPYEGVPFKEISLTFENQNNELLASVTDDI
jgi:hypothetical protein